MQSHSWQPGTELQIGNSTLQIRTCALEIRNLVPRYREHRCGLTIRGCERAFRVCFDVAEDLNAEARRTQRSAEMVVGVVGV